MTLPKIRNDKSDNPRNRKRQLINTENAVGRRLIESLGQRDFGWLSGKSGIPVSTISDYVQRGISKSDNAVKISEALDVSLDWLLTGRRAVDAKPAAALIAVEGIDWVSVPHFDLRKLNDTGKGEPVEWTPFRKDWLNNTLGRSTELWLTSILADYPAIGLADGDQVFCIEIEPVELIDGQLCLFRTNQSLMIGRYLVRPPAPPATGDLTVKNYVTPGEIGTDDDKFVPIARILARYGVQRL